MVNDKLRLNYSIKLKEVQNQGGKLFLTTILKFGKLPVSVTWFYPFINYIDQVPGEGRGRTRDRTRTR